MTSAPFTTRTEIEAEIARLTRQRNEWNILGWSDWDSDAEIAAEIADLEDDLYRLEHAAEYDAPFTNAQIDAAQERMANLLGFTEADLTEIETATERKAA